MTIEGILFAVPVPRTQHTCLQYCHRRRDYLPAARDLIPASRRVVDYAATAVRPVPALQRSTTLALAAEEHPGVWQRGCALTGSFAGQR